VKIPNYLHFTSEAQEELDSAQNGIVSFSSIVSASYRIKKHLKGEVRDGKFHVQVDVETLRALIAEHRRFSWVSGGDASEEIKRAEHRVESCRQANRFLDLSEPTRLLAEATRLLITFYKEGRTQFLPALEKACEAANLAENETAISLTDIARALLENAPASVDVEKVYAELSRAYTRKGPREIAELSRICAKLRDVPIRRETRFERRLREDTVAEPTVVVEGNRTTISVGPR
jgi:hypothetical protein